MELENNEVYIEYRETVETDTDQGIAGHIVINIETGEMRDNKFHKIRNLPQFLRGIAELIEAVGKRSAAKSYLTLGRRDLANYCYETDISPDLDI